MSKLPSFQFYPGDWMKDPALALCSAGARGVWMDVLCLMFESQHRGYLFTNGRPWTLEQIAVALRGDWQENLVYLKELVHNGVMRRVEARKSGRKCPRFLGSFFSARIVTDQVRRDEWKAQKRRQRIENKRSVSTHLSALSSSSSSSSPSKKEENHDDIGPRPAFSSPGCDRFCEAYPNKLDPKREVFASWCRAGGDHETEIILAGLAVWTAHWNGDGRYVPTATKFLKRRQWEQLPPKGGRSNGQQSFADQRSKQNAESLNRVLGHPEKASGNVRRALPPAGE